MTAISAVIAGIRHKLHIMFICLIVCLIPLPIIFIVIIPSFIYRNVIKLIAWLFRPDLAEIFRGKGAFFALESVHTKPKLSILLHFIFDGSIPLDKLRSQFQTKIINDTDKAGNLVYPQLRQCWEQFLGFLFWKWESNFNLNNHIKLLDDIGLNLPTPCTEDDLKRVTAELLARPYAPNQSPWEALVIPNYRATSNKDGRAQMAIVFRIHHAMADGYSILGMMFKLFDLQGSKVPKANFPKLSLGQQIMRSVIMPLKLPWDVAVLLVNSYDGENAWHLVDKKLERKYHTFFSDQILVEDVKRIKNKFGVGYNAAVYAVATGGIRRLMQEAGQTVPKSLSCFVPFPLPRHPGGLAVHVSGFFFKFSPIIQDPAKRLLEISQNMQVLNTAPTVPIVFSWAVNLFALMPVWGMRTVFNKMMMTLGMTSFPGPETELDIMDCARLVDIIPALGTMSGNLGATAVLVSIAGKQRIALSVDRKVFENSKLPQHFAQHVNEEVQALLDAKTPTKHGLLSV